MTAIERRDFLRLAAAASVAAATAGCTHRSPAPDASSSNPPTPSAPPPSQPPASSPSPATDLTTLKKKLGDRLILPSDGKYPTAAQVYDPRFDAIHPAAVAKCASPDDVTTCLRYVKASGAKFAVRSGGHSYAGYSTSSGLVIDVGPMNAINPATTPGTARIGAGARLADVYVTLAAQGVSIPAGSCPTVGVTGLALGGGIGVVGRKYGLTCDRLTAVELVTADGEQIRCDATNDSDLFWAHRGGGGGNFGVVTALEFATHRTQPLSYFLLRWDWAHAADVLAGWQSWLPTTPDELWSSLHVDGAGSSNTTPKVYVSGVYVGALTDLQKLINALQDDVKAPMSSRFANQTDYLKTMMIEGGCANFTVAECHPEAEGGKLPRSPQLARSDLIADPLTSSGIETVLGAIEQRQRQGLPGGSVLFDAYGGAINRVGPTETAFVHRDKLACLQYVAPLINPAQTTANQAWLDGLHANMRSHVSGYAYQNYIDPQLSDWQHAYYGVNLERLRGVKSAYDPDDLFRFAQSIPTR